MIEEALPGIHRIELPLPGNPLRAINSYLIRGDGRDLLIDTGMNRSECRDALLAALGKLEVNPEKLDLFITHLHADHSGLAGSLATDSSTVYCSEEDGSRIVNGSPWEEMIASARLNGFPEDELRVAQENHPGWKYRIANRVRITPVADGDEIAVGGYRFSCVETPGHTKGHLCLYDPGRRVLVSGDHILDDITPNISFWTSQGDPLGDYLRSLDRVAQLDVKLVLPGHRRLIEDCGKRIQELKAHHQTRSDEILSILDGGPLSGYRVASAMRWDLRYDSWEQFPVAQKWFATAEALAHLRYLEELGELSRITSEGRAAYSRKAS